jgi:2-hydroxy-3-oxopropionate reductase
MRLENVSEVCMDRKVGFIGLGVMGGHMARNLGKRFDLMVFDVDLKRMDSIEGAEKAASVEDVGKGADTVLLSLPGSEIVHDVVYKLMDTLSEGAVVIDTSTTEPTVSRSLASELAQKGIDFLDSPVSGGEGGAKDATLAIMVGGPEKVFETCKPILETMGKTVIRIGETGSGGVAKLINNMIVGSAFTVIAESFALGMKNGIDLKVLYEAIKDGWAGSKVLDVAALGTIKNDFVPGGTVDIHFKDLGYALSLANSQDVPIPMTALSHEIFKAARAAGKGPYAQHIVIQLWEKLLEGQS